MTITIPLGLCGCGCGEKTRVAAKTDARYGAIAGKPVRFVRGHQLRVDETMGRPQRVDPKVAAYAEELVAVAEQFVGTVRDEGADAAAEVFQQAMALRAPAGVNPALAFAVCIAAQVDVDSPRSRRLGWVEDLDPRTRTTLATVRPLGVAS